MPAETGSNPVVRFGVFEADLASGELRKGGVKVKLQEQPFQTLALLLERPGEVVTREEIKRRLWPADTFVDFDHGLNKAINRLRDALGDSADEPRFIETLPKRGYRFIAPIDATSAEPSLQAPRSAAPPSATLRSRWRLWISSAAVVVAVGVAVAYYSRPHRPALTERDTVVLADFDNRTGDPAFDYTLKQALGIGLEASSLVRTLPDQKVVDTLRLMHRKPDEKLTSDTAREVCERASAKAVLGGYVERLGTEYVIGLTAMNCSTGDPLAQEQVRAPRKEDVLDRFDRSVVALRSQLGESLAAIQTPDRRVHDVLSTSSLDAFEAYTNGERMTLAGRPPLALFKRATELDPEFAYAHASVGLIYGNLGETSLSSDSTRRAYELRDRVSDWERYFITAQYHFRVTGNIDQIVPVGQTWIQQYPRERTSRNRLAFAYRQLGQYDKALAEYQQARQFGGSHPLDLLMLARTYTNLDRLDEAANIVKDGLTPNPDDRRFRNAEYILEFLRGRTEDVAHTAADAAPNSPSEEEFRFLQSDTEAYFGRFAKARELTRQVVESARQKDLMGRAAVWLAADAVRASLAGDAAAARAQARGALALTTGWDVRALTAVAFARIGDIDDATKLADGLTADLPASTLVQNYWLPAIRADIELARGNATSAIDLLRRASAYDLADTALLAAPPLYPVYIRGLAYLRAHDGAASAAEFQKILGHRGIVVNSPVAALAHLGLARAYALAGETSKARSAYQSFLALWKGADSDMPAVKEARTEFARLHDSTPPQIDLPSRRH
jgi:eukaryotic-like serine/threonine-protein kinase